jgi:hypothetical protein
MENREYERLIEIWRNLDKKVLNKLLHLYTKKEVVGLSNKQLQCFDNMVRKINLSEIEVGAIQKFDEYGAYYYSENNPYRYKNKNVKKSKKVFAWVFIIIGIAVISYGCHFLHELIFNNLDCCYDYDSEYTYYNNSAGEDVTVNPIKSPSGLNTTMCNIGASVGVIFWLLSMIFYGCYLHSELTSIKKWKLRKMYYKIICIKRWKELRFGHDGDIILGIFISISYLLIVAVSFVIKLT